MSKIMVPNKRKCISGLLATVILCVISIIVTFLVSSWYSAIGISSGIELNIYPKIYSPKSNIGILNEEGVFNIIIKNYENYTQEIIVYFKSDIFYVNNQTLNIDANKSLNVSLSQKLINPGIWTIEAWNEDKILESYSFLVVINRGEAETKINQWNNIKFNNNLSIIAVILSSISIVGTCINLYDRSRVKLSGDVRQRTICVTLKR